MLSRKSLWELLVVWIVVVITLKYLAPSNQSEIMGSQESARKVVSSVASLTSDFFGRVVEENEGKNVFVSAFSLSSALTMAAVGARGNTQKEMLQVLHLDVDPAQLPGAYGALLHSSNLFNAQGGPVQLNNANRLWIEKSFPIHPDFAEATGKHFDASAEPADFTGNPENERVRINQWVEKQTHDKIKDLIPSGGIKSDTPLVLTNAIYFKANWVRRFDSKRSAKGDFTLLSKEKTRATYMHDKYKLPYTHQGDYSAIEKNYTSPSGKSLSMVFLLPEDPGVEGLKKTLAALKPTKPGQLPPFLTQLFEQEVVISIPKFKMEFEVEASRILKNLGMKEAFGQADFSGISSHRLTIGQVYHKAFVEVNEEGTEAAAATAVVMMRSAAIRREITFNANRPFIFLIWDRPSGLILFTGLVNKPDE